MAGHAKLATQEGWFGWERPNLDFPFYNEKDIPLWKPLLLICSSAIVLLCTVLKVFDFGRTFTAFFILLGTLVPFLIVAHGNIGTLVKKPRLGDIPLILITFILYYIYAMVMATLLSWVFGMGVEGNSADSEAVEAVFYVLMFIQLIGEELIKINFFLGLFTLLFGFSVNRKTSIVIATFVTLLCFGIAHLPAYGGRIAQVVFVQGFGSIFNMFCYLKTKNILVSYGMHVLTDFVAFIVPVIFGELLFLFM